jgi:hypothetical protein
MTRALALGTATLVALALFFGSGTDTTRLAWIGGLAAILWAIAAATLPAPRLTRAAWAFFALLAAFGLWSALSILWSLAPDRSWDAANRVFAYAAVAALGTYVARLGSERVAAAATVLLGAVAGWALLGRVATAVGPDTERVDRLRSPVGYWNVLAFLLAALVPLALLLARRRRVEGSLLAYAAFVALLLTYSRAGLVVALGAAVLWIALTTPRPELLALLVVALGAAAPVAALDFDGAAFALALVVGAAAVGALAWAIGLQRDTARAVLAVAALALAAGLVVGVVRVGNPLSWAGDRIDEFTNPPSVQRRSTELFTATSNNRWTWWTEAWDAWREEPVAGTGAGSFDLVHRLRRENGLNVREPHSLAVEVLSETGIVGFLLFAGAVAAAVAVCVRRAREPAGAALVAGVAALFVQSLVDIHWSYAAAAVPVFVALGALAANGVAERRPRGLLVPFAAALLALAAVYSLAAPALADHYVAVARDRIARKDYTGAENAAKLARSLDPVAIEPIIAQATAVAGQRRDARRLFIDAIELQPENWRPWYELGQYEATTLNALDDAFLDLDKAYSLDPRNVAVGDALDATRKRLERR